MQTNYVTSTPPKPIRKQEVKSAVTLNEVMKLI